MLDFSLLPEIDYAHTFFRLNDDHLTPLRRLARTQERIKNAVRFAWYSTSNAEIMHCQDEDAPTLRNGFLRAALTELVSTEDVLAADLADAGIPKPARRLNESPRPHLHLIRELRNLEVHLSHHRLVAHQRHLMLGRIDQPERAHAVTVDVWTLDGITVDSFSKLRNAKYYSRREIERLVAWFDSTQNEWGVDEIFLRAAQDYCRELAREYPNAA